jgi:membrane protein implicated in regulation of membrane protease activity
MSAGWVWLYAGAALMMMELASPTFVTFFFGLAAATVGVMCMVFGRDFSLIWQLSAFGILLIVYLAVLRAALKKLFKGIIQTSKTDFTDDFSGKLAVVTEEINPPLSGRVMLGDSEWSAVADSFIDKGANVRVLFRNNLTLKVEKI